MQKLITHIAAQYNFPHLRYAGPVDQGYLSQNDILAADNRRFFLKQYRFTERDGNASQLVAIIHRAKFHFADHGIPAILPLPTQNGQTFFVWDKRCYALFPFIENGIKTKRGEMPLAVLKSAGDTLGRLHRAGHNVFNIAPVRGKATFDAGPFWEKSERILAIIAQRDKLSPFDELAQETLRLKRSLAKENPPIFTELGLSDDHLVHGDYQNDNFFVDESNQVSHVFDWELTKVTAREADLLRSILFICLQKGGDFTLTLTPATVAQAEHYLRSYHEAYPVHPQKLAAAVDSRQLGNIYSLWVEEEHYLLDNDRVDLFLPGASHALQYFAENKESFTQMLLEMIC